MNTCNRLREERERLGYSQSSFGEIGGVKKLAQINYEKGERQPDAAYLAAIAVVGADVLYILTGQRSQPITATPLPPRQAALLDNYQHLSEEDKKALERTASALAQSKEAMKTKVK